MSIFISHSSKDNLLALRIHRYIQALGEKRVFLDIDPVGGITTGEYFVRELSKSYRESDVYIFVVSDDWLSSSWCMAEYKASLLHETTTIFVLTENMNFDVLPPEIAAIVLAP